MIKLTKNFLKAYEKINEITICNITNNQNTKINDELIKTINKEKTIYNKEKQELINEYIKKPTIKTYEHIIKKYKTKLHNYNHPELDEIKKFIKNNIKSYDINKKQKINIPLNTLIEKNKLYKKYKKHIIFHLSSNIKGYRTIYLPLKNECHIFGNYQNTYKDIKFIFHELGHCIQLLSTKKIIFDTTLAELYACTNEILMSKNTIFEEFIIKSINNNILESICTFNFYEYIYKEKKFNQDKLEKKWKELCINYNIKYKPKKWLNDINSIENPQNILSYTIAYIIALKFTDKNYNYFKYIYNININKIIKNLNNKEEY